MDQHDNERLAEPTKPKGWRVIWNISGALVLGALGNGVWEALVRPGFGWLGTTMSAIASRFDSEVFASAALDPTPVPAVALLMLICTIPFTLSGLLLGLVLRFQRIDQIFNRRLKRLKVAVGRDAALRRVLQRMAVFFSIGLFGLGVLAFVAFSIQNKATLVWRMFHANLDIVTPYISDDHRRQLVSRFRTMKTEADFLSLRKELDAAVPKTGRPLDWTGT